MKNLGILISESFFLGLALLKGARQGISRSISFSLTVIDSKVLSREFLCPADLARAQTLCIHKSMEIVMVIKDEYLVFVAFQVVVPSLKGFNNSQELLVVGFVSSLNRDYFLRKKGY